MEANIKLLNFIYKNALMGVDTITELLDIVNVEKFIDQLISQMEEYRMICSKAKELLDTLGGKKKDIPPLQKISTYLMLNIQTLADKSASHIAQMMITGSTMGVIDAIKNIRNYPNAAKEVVSLMEDLLVIEEDNIEKLKIYL